MDFKTCIRKAINAATRPLPITQPFRQGPIMLYFHGVEQLLLDERIQEEQLSLTEFERILRFLKHHFELISLDDLDQAMQGNRPLSPRQALLTFDDGYRNNWKVLGPLLKAEGAPFAVFISTRHIAEGRRFPFYYARCGILFTQRKNITLDHPRETFALASASEKDRALALIGQRLRTAPLAEVHAIEKRLQDLLPASHWHELDEKFSSEAPMTWEEVRAVRDCGAIIGAHCHDHIILHANQPREQVEAQLRQSKELIEHEVGPCPYFAYPNGTAADISPVALEEVRRQGFRLALTAECGEVRRGINPLLLPRFIARTAEVLEFVIRTMPLRQASYHSHLSPLQRP